MVERAYTAEQFRSLAEDIETNRTAYWAGHDAIVLAALRIASRVVEPGVIEQSVADYWQTDVSLAADSPQPSMIRTALTKDIR